MNNTPWWSRYTAVALIMMMMLFACSAGCIKMIQKSIGEGESATSDTTPVFTPDALMTPEYEPPAVLPTIQQTITQVMPLKSEAVSEVTPIITPDPYPRIQGVRINSTPRYSFLDRTPEFKKTYTLRGNATGLLVNVVQGPLYIVYTVNPMHDCLKNPESCRGTLTVPVNRPYMTITVRDNQTHNIIAQDGYAREYSGDIGDYTFSFTKTGTEGSKDETSVSEPGPRYIAIYREGQFHITTEGNYLDVTLSIITGASPDPLEAGGS